MLHVFMVKLDGRSSWHQNNILNSHDIIYVLYFLSIFYAVIAFIHLCYVYVVLHFVICIF